jgi:hypothetical protein
MSKPQGGEESEGIREQAYDPHGFHQGELSQEWPASARGGAGRL